MQSSEEPKQSKLTIEHFEMVITLAHNWVGEIKSLSALGMITPDKVHETIVNYYAKLIQVFRKQAGEDQFNHIFAAAHPDSPLKQGYEERDLNKALGDLTSLSRNLRSLKN